MASGPSQGCNADPWGVGPLGGAQAKYTAFLERLSPEVLKEERARVRVAAVPLESPAAAPVRSPPPALGKVDRMRSFT